MPWLMKRWALRGGRSGRSGLGSCDDAGEGLPGRAPQTGGPGGAAREYGARLDGARPGALQGGAWGSDGAAPHSATSLLGRRQAPCASGSCPARSRVWKGRVDKVEEARGVAQPLPRELPRVGHRPAQQDHRHALPGAQLGGQRAQCAAAAVVHPPLHLSWRQQRRPGHLRGGRERGAAWCWWVRVWVRARGELGRAVGQLCSELSCTEQPHAARAARAG